MWHSIQHDCYIHLQSFEWDFEMPGIVGIISHCLLLRIAYLNHSQALTPTLTIQVQPHAVQSKQSLTRMPTHALIQ